jgi:hypothetical protein
MTDRFEELLAELGPVFGLSLHPDKIGACSIEINPHLKVQLQLDISQEKLLFFCKIIEIPPGKFRENVLKTALQYNNLPDPLAGILAYFSVTNHLIAYQSYPVLVLNRDRLAALLGAFLEMSETWYQAIKSGQSGPQILTTTSSSSNPFGLKP